MRIYCCGCESKINAILISGLEVYPHRKDLHSLPFWRCDKCSLYVGCHHKSSNPTSPLGCIPTKAIKQARQHIHKLFDPIWKHKKMSRSKLYSIVSKKLGYEYHTAEIRSIEDARVVYRIVRDISQGK